jgi:hypothetical protein
MIKPATAVLRREIDSADEAMRPIIQVRVSTDALRGTPAAVALTPERLRVLGHCEHDFHNGASPVEILVHPEDWAEALAEIPDLGAGVDLTQFYGYKVVR